VKSHERPSGSSRSRGGRSRTGSSRFHVDRDVDVQESEQARTGTLPKKPYRPPIPSKTVVVHAEDVVVLEVVVFTWTGT
jgi:hypothetical protein